MKTKVEKLLAAYEKFAADIAAIPDATAQKLHQLASGVRQFVESAKSTQPNASASQIASGLEQGWREMPFLMSEVDVHWRWAVSQAFQNAAMSVCPELVEADQVRLQKILARGKIRTEKEYHLVRYHIDVLEGQPELPPELRTYYSLVEVYEAAI